MPKRTLKSWPFSEAQKLQKRFQDNTPLPLRFETGFGPSGLPHIGTFAEVARTTWVRHAYEQLTGHPTELIAFSDDMDGLRKVPLNMPQQKMLQENLGKPLCHIPDPYGEEASYSGYMNARLNEFLNRYGFNYRFQSSQEAYARGDFNEGLAVILKEVEGVKAIILPTMSEAKRKGWSPFFPICERCGRISTTRVTAYHPDRNALDYCCDRSDDLVPSCGHTATTTIFNGKVKVGWKVDWALRWYSYDIAYEMYGKDLIDSAKLSGKIIRLMGKQPPTGYFYELFLDEEGRKISKSVGKGLTIDAWTSYAPLESLLYFIFQNPKQAKRLFWGVVPKSVDDYLGDLANYPRIDAAKKPDAPVWHIFDKGRQIPPYTSTITFSLINNLISAVGTDDADLIIEYLRRYDPDIGTHAAVVEDLVKKGMHYYRDHILPHKQFRTPADDERQLLLTLQGRLVAYAGEDENELQTIPFDVARSFDVAPKALFKTFYEVVLGQDRGPRFGTFIRLVGKERVLALMDRVLESG